MTEWEKLYPLLSEDKRKEWAKRYKKKFGKDFVPPKEDELEDLQEMVKLMEETPNYTISKQGRE